MDIFVLIPADWDLHKKYWEFWPASFKDCLHCNSEILQHSIHTQIHVLPFTILFLSSGFTFFHWPYARYPYPIHRSVLYIFFSIEWKISYVAFCFGNVTCGNKFPWKSVTPLSRYLYSYFPFTSYVLYLYFYSRFFTFSIPSGLQRERQFLKLEWSVIRNQDINSPMSLYLSRLPTFLHIDLWLDVESVLRIIPFIHRAYKLRPYLLRLIQSVIEFWKFSEFRTPIY